MIRYFTEFGKYRKIKQSLSLSQIVFVGDNCEMFLQVGLSLGCITSNELFNHLCAAVKKSRQCRTSSSHGRRENSTEKHQPVSEGISWEPGIISSHIASQMLAKKISFQVTENDMMVAEQV